jgi:N-methylhydantoinase B
MHSPSPNQAVDPVVAEIIRHQLLSITDQIEANLTRTAYSPLIYEYKDYCVGLLDNDGRIIAQSRGSIPIFLADLGASICEGLQIYGPDGFEPGDVIITNYPGTTGQHLNNVDMYTPIFVAAELVGFMAIRAHWADIGGRYVGSASSNDTTEIFQEGIQFRCVRLRRRGEPVAEIYRMIEYNTRLPDMVLGDVEAQLAGCLMGRDLFLEVVAKHGWPTLTRTIDAIWDETEVATRRAVQGIPDGTYTAESFLDNDGVNTDKPIPVRVAVHVEGDEMTVDLSNIADQVDGPFNSGHSGGGVTAAKVAFKYITTPAELVNDGSFRNLHVVLPPGKFLSADADAAMARWSTPLPTVIDTILRSLAEAVPQRVTAGHHASMGAFQFAGIDPDTGRLYKMLDTALGGWGARRGADGAGPFKTLAHGDTLDIPVEIQEALYPLRIESYGFRPDSGGAGRWRGGVGLAKTYRILAPCQLTVVFERFGCPPWGLFGGAPAQPGTVILEREGEAPRRVQKLSSFALVAGDRIHVLSGGGGGYDLPLDRPPADVARDARHGYVSVAGARRDYGVVLRGDMCVDETETRRLRARLSSASNSQD